MNFRTVLQASDIKAIAHILNSTGFFYDHEVEVAVSLAEENLEQGDDLSGYLFIMAEENEQVIGYSCFGKTPSTEASYDLYWLGVNEENKGKGIGKILLSMTEKMIAELGGKNIWIETAGRPLYEPTRMFYLKTGCELVAELPEFYGKGDDKVIFLKKV